MADISFVPSFHHVDFVDDDAQVANPDRVRADEPNGFNQRFGNIESDLTQLSTVVGQFTAAINARGTGGNTLRLTLPPALVPLGSSPPWTITATGAAQTPTGVNGVRGLIEVSVPPGLAFVSLRAIGTCGAAGQPPVVVTLSRFPIQSAGPQEIATVTGGTAPFDLTQPALPAAPTGASFRYFITASVASAVSTPAVLSAVQRVLQPA